MRRSSAIFGHLRDGVGQVRVHRLRAVGGEGLFRSRVHIGRDQHAVRREAEVIEDGLRISAGRVGELASTGDLARKLGATLAVNVSEKAVSEVQKAS